MPKRELVDLTLFKHMQTDKAVLVSDDGDRSKAVWLPLSQIEMEKGKSPDLIEITLPEWLAHDKGLI